MKKLAAIGLKIRAIQALKQKISCTREELVQLCSDPENMDRVINLMIAQRIVSEKEGQIVLGDSK